jgi:hypothetical protein
MNPKYGDIFRKIGLAYLNQRDVVIIPLTRQLVFQWIKCTRCLFSNMQAQTILSSFLTFERVFCASVLSKVEEAPLCGQ